MCSLVWVLYVTQYFYFLHFRLFSNSHNLYFHMNMPLFKVHIFWKGHKFLRNLHCSNCQITVEISQNFVAFSEYMNFTFLTKVSTNKKADNKNLHHINPAPPHSTTYVTLIYTLLISRLHSSNQAWL